MVKIGVIGGTGLDADLNILRDAQMINVGTTPYGRPSDEQVTSGKIDNVDIVVMSRHGKRHDRNPSDVNYRANLWTLKELGCTHILVTNACGSLQEEFKPGMIAIVDQYIDRTKSRPSTFYKVIHIPQAHPFDKTVQMMIEEACKTVGAEYRSGACIVACEGPRYSTFAESKLFKSWGGDIIGMTTVPEAPLAAELGLFYNSIGLVTDYDCWHEDEGESVTVELVDKRMKMLAGVSRKVLIETIKRIGKHDWSEKIAAKTKEAQGAIMFK
ncbi:S-methyl-5'-thioadenosine phosphorylase [Tetranychus urticae]|uniref:S-methyl-5'-thioadenosine phosphorylase n=1 Tax=Tetranychus urticae TaxID=32264 RepID=T1K1W3_TETUR|nr:S-methyl-5'-thioadenosine phosphorylase [Tetranychus urticae]